MRNNSSSFFSITCRYAFLCLCFSLLAVVSPADLYASSKYESSHKAMSYKPKYDDEGKAGSGSDAAGGRYASTPSSSYRSIINTKKVSDMSITIEVDVTSSSVKEAKKIAIYEAQRRAFWEMLNHLAPDHADMLHKNITQEQALELMRIDSVSNEKISKGRYKADLTFKFDDNRTTRMLADNIGVITHKTIETLLILPVFNNGEYLNLWYEGNPWIDIMRSVLLELGIDNMVTPYGDPYDKEMITDEVLLSGDPDILKDVAARYGTRNVVIMIAKPDARSDNLKLEIVLRRAGSNREEAKLQYRAREGEALDSLLRRAAIDIISRLGESRSKYAILKPDEETTKKLVLNIKFKDGKEWEVIREIINKMPMVDNIEIRQISFNDAQMVIYHKTNISLITKLLQQRNMKVTNKKDNSLSIQMNEAR